MSMTPATVHRMPSPTEGISIDREAVLKVLNLPPNDPKTHALLLVCERYNLDPLLKHMVLISGNAYVTRDGYLAIAHRSGQFDGMEVIEQGETSSHFTAKVAVWRKDMTRPFTFVGRFPKAKSMAKEYGPEMAVKVAEVQSLRRAFNVTGISAADEMWEDDPPHPPALPKSASAHPASDAEPAAGDTSADLAARIADLDERDRETVASTWQGSNLPPLRHDDFTKLHALIAAEMLDAIEQTSYDRRRKHVNAKMGEVGIKGDEARHELVSRATNGETESTKRLTRPQVDAIVAMCAAFADEDSAGAA